MIMTVLKNGVILGSEFEFIDADLIIENGRISDITKNNKVPAADDVIDCTDCFILPGYIDIHTHGCAGYDNMDIGMEAMEAISSHMAYNGTTTYLPTIMTASQEIFIASAKNIRKFAESGRSSANIGGIYVEGPYFSEIYKGAQNPAYLRDPNIGEFEELYEASGGLLKIVSLAPERDGSMEFINAASKKVRIAIGHTDADYETTIKAEHAGASQITHLFNAMRPMHHRQPNAIGAALDSNMLLECICDGFHIHPAIIRSLFRAAADRIVLISDSLRPTGMPDGIYDSGGQDVKMYEGKLYLNDGSNTIAGSSVHMADCVKRVVEFGISIEEAVKAASFNPAVSAGLEDVTGSLKKGLRADILITDRQLNIKHVIIRGKIYR